MYKLTGELPRRISATAPRRVVRALQRGWTGLRAVPTEATVWIAGLLALASADPTAPPLIDLCVFKALGAAFCPGCGLGHAIAWLARGEVVASFQAHPLGIPAVAVLLHHVVRLTRRT
jgi:hypothetical protein